MNLKEQLGILARKYEKQMEDERREEERKKIRSPEDWEIIEEYLRKLLTKFVSSKELAKVGFGWTKFIPIECGSSDILYPKDDKRRLLFLKDGKPLEITQEDLERFCNQHNLKLRYLLNDNDCYRFSRKYDKFNTHTFLIGI